VVGASPGQSPFFTTIKGFDSTGGTAEGYYEGLQVQPNTTNPNYPMYRPGVTVYKVNTDSTPAATGNTLANPQYGPGNVPQLFIPGYDTSLTPLYSIPFKPK
jgi:filamentous hemagglutinin